MDFVRSILVGLSLLIGAAILLLVIIVVTTFSPPGTAVGFDLVSMARHSPSLWILAVLAFSLGFHWEYRRLKLRQAG